MDHVRRQVGQNCGKCVLRVIKSQSWRWIDSNLSDTWPMRNSARNKLGNLQLSKSSSTHHHYYQWDLFKFCFFVLNFFKLHKMDNRPSSLYIICLPVILSVNVLHPCSIGYITDKRRSGTKIIATLAIMVLNIRTIASGIICNKVLLYWKATTLAVSRRRPHIACALYSHKANFGNVSGQQLVTSWSAGVSRGRSLTIYYRRS